MATDSRAKALILVDFQNDFVQPSGKLYIPGSEKLTHSILDKIKQVQSQGILVIALMDWHPKKHMSFQIWPEHAVAGTWGAELSVTGITFDKIIKKGFNPEYDSYSGFFDDNNKSNGLHEYLQSNQVKTLEIIGVATDVCVSKTVQHALELGYNTLVNLDLCRGSKNWLIFKNFKPRS